MITYGLATEKKEQAFAFKTSELARSLVIIPGDSPEVYHYKRDQGFYVDLRGSQMVVEAIAASYHQHGDGSKRLSTTAEGFEDLLVLAANDSVVLQELGLVGNELRLALFCGAEAAMFPYKKLIARSKLGKPVQEVSGNIIKPDGVMGEERRRAIDVLQRFQENLLQRVSPSTPDIRNR